MATSTPRFVTRAMKSVVVVRDRVGDYSAGFVVVNHKAGAGTEPLTTLVVAPTHFVKGKAELSVAFFEGLPLPASVVAEDKFFSLLRTPLHPTCEAIRLLEHFNPSSFLPRPTFVVPPYSPTKTYFVPTYATLESLESYNLEKDVICLESSRNYFLIACDHEDRTHSGKLRLAASPVFVNETATLKGLAMGFVLQVSHVGNNLMKVGVTSTYFKEILKRLDPPPPPRKPRREEAKKILPQKRGRDGQRRGRGGQKKKRFN